MRLTKRELEVLFKHSYTGSNQFIIWSSDLAGLSRYGFITVDIELHHTTITNKGIKLIESLLLCTNLLLEEGPEL